MAGKKRGAKVVHAPKAPSSLCGVITQKQLLQMDRAARRSAAIESGISPTSGCGVHGGNTKQQNKKNRRKAKLEMRSWSRDE